MKCPGIDPYTRKGCRFERGHTRAFGGCASPEPRFPDDLMPRVEGCVCHWEEGDSPCPVHGLDGETP